MGAEPPSTSALGGAPAGADAPLVPASLLQWLGYFLNLGTFGFGGPIALAGYMQRQLVDERRWVSQEDYLEGLALAQLAPGPLAAQLAMYLGWVRAGVLGATVVGVAFTLPSFLMVWALAWAYVRYQGLPWMQSAFYGIGAAVIAIIARSVVKLLKLTLKRDPLLWGLFAVLAVTTAVTGKEVVWLFLLAGLVALLVKAPPRLRRAPVAAWPWVLSGLAGAAPVVLAPTLGRIFWFFTTAGAFVFGSGLAVVPFLYGGLVHQYHWLNDRQFLDAVAVAMITPGPVVITVAFIGYLLQGLPGAAVSAVGVFVPCYLMVVTLAPSYRKWARHPQVGAFVAGVTAGAAGAIAGAAVVLARRAITDVPTVLIAVVTYLLMTYVKRLPEPLIVLGAGIVGFLVKVAVR